MKRSILLFVLAAPLALGAPAVRAQSSRVDSGLYAGLRWRSIGPFRSAA